MHSFETRTLSDAAASLRRANGKCVILMGAGCSKSAGIPLAGELISEIERDYPEAFRRAKDNANSQRPDYNAVMDELSLTDQETLLTRHIDAAKLNWAHLALAQLFTRQKMDRILTVNFDPLLVKACALVNFFPAIYDLAGNNQFKPRRIAPQSVFFLNGQHTGFVMLNGIDELDEHKTKLRQIVQNTGVNRLWLVVGYSGEADPLLDVLAEQESFDGDLYWLGYEPTPSEHLLKSHLFEKGRRAFYVGGQDADQCLTHLAQKLQCFPPNFLVRPFEHLRQIVEPILFETGGPAALSMRNQLFSQLEAATQRENSPEQQNTSNAKTWLLAGEPDRVIEWFEQLPDKTQEAMELVSWAHVEVGNSIVKEAERRARRNHKSIDQQLLWQKAGTHYRKSLSINNKRHEAANNWGLALAKEACSVQDEDLIKAQKLWSEAGEKYAKALDIKPLKHEAAYNWGSALNDEAQAIQAQSLENAQSLWSKARDMYAKALEIKPDKYEAADNWGVALAREARAIQTHDLKNARLLWSKACDMYSKALCLKPDCHEAANNWGHALAAEAQAIHGNFLSEAIELWKDADEKYRLSIYINSNQRYAINNRCVALLCRYHAITQIYPSEAQDTLCIAIHLLEEHSANSPHGRVAVAYNLACAYSLQQRAADAIAQLDILINAGALRKHFNVDKDFDPIRHTPEFLAWVEKNFPETTTAPI